MLSDELPPRAEAELLASVERFVRVARELGVKPVLCTFALSHRMSQRSELPDTWAYFAYSFNMHLSMRGWIRTVERLNGGLAEIAARLDVPLIDLDAQLGGHPELYSDLHHFKWEGHERVAELATQALLTIADGGS